MEPERDIRPYIRIIEQPARSAVRFRYECEGRSAGPIPGISSSPQCASYPTIQIFNYKRRAMVVVSCVTASPPFRQHPHHLVGRVGCHNGICSMIIDTNDLICSFTHLGIQCAKRNEIASRLKQRKMMGIDPTNAGYDHINKSSRSIDLGVIRLCFQAFIEDPITGKFTIPLEPVISDPVHDKKLLPKLIMSDISTTSAPLSGGKVMIFCNYIDEDDIEVRFYELNDESMVIWESFADLKPPIGEVHKRVALSFIAPPYPCFKTEPVRAFLQLRRPSDGRTSNPIAFTYLPQCSYDNCPLIKYQREERNQKINDNPLKQHDDCQSLVPSPQVKRRGTNINQMEIPKKARVLNVINASDSDSDELITNAMDYQNANESLSGQMLTDQNNNIVSNNSSNNDLLMECLKTIDMEYLTNMELMNDDHDWSVLYQ